MTEKQRLRREFLKNRDKMPKKVVEEKSRHIYNNFVHSSIYDQCESIFIYISMNNEADTIKIINKGLEEGKIIAVPKVNPKKKEMIFLQINSLEELEKGHFNVFEPRKEYIRPIASNKNTLILVPGVVFDLHKNRIGYGGGYYDRYLSSLTAVRKLIGIGYDFQVTDQIPSDTYDIPLDYLITEKRWIH